MARRETGVWLPVSAAFAGLAFYSAGIAIFELVSQPKSPMYVFPLGLASIVIGLLLLPAVCAWCNPWWRFSDVALYLAFAQLLLLPCIISIQTWRFGHTPQWEVFGYIFLFCACVVMGCWAFLKALRTVRELKQPGELH